MNKTWDLFVTAGYFALATGLFFLGSELLAVLMVGAYVFAWKRDVNRLQAGKHKSEVTRPIRFVQQYERDVVFYFGEHHRSTGPGLHVRIPLISQATIANLQWITFDVPDLEVKLAHDIFVKMDLQVRARILDDGEFGNSAVGNNGNLYRAVFKYRTRRDLVAHIIQIIQQTISRIAGRGEDGHGSYDWFVGHQEVVVREAQTAIDGELLKNGVKVTLKMTQGPIPANDESKKLIDSAYTASREASATRERGYAAADVAAETVARTEKARRKAEAEGVVAMDEAILTHPRGAAYARDRATIEAMTALAAAGNVVVHDSSNPNSPFHIQLEMRRDVGGGGQDPQRDRENDRGRGRRDREENRDNREGRGGRK